MRVKNIEKSNGLRVANQFIIEVEEGYIFQSYDAIIASYNHIVRTLVVSIDWNYSRTTSKYFKLFLQQYTGATDEEIEAIKKELKKADNKHNIPCEFTSGIYNIKYVKEIEC